MLGLPRGELDAEVTVSVRLVCDALGLDAGALARAVATSTSSNSAARDNARVLLAAPVDGEAVSRTIDMGQGSEPTNCCLGDGILYVTLSGTVELASLPIDAEPLPLYLARR